MVELLIEMLRRYGSLTVIVAVVLGSVIWIAAHFSSAPGTQISILWGLVTYTKDSDVSAKPRVQVEAPISNLQPEKPVSPQAEVQQPSLKSYEIVYGVNSKQTEKAVAKLRTKYELRELTSMESGKRVTETPPGTFFFVLSLIGDKPADERYLHIEQLTVSRYPVWKIADLEIHRTRDGDLFFLAFTTDVDANRITALSGVSNADVVLLPEVDGDFKNLVRVPLQRVVSIRSRESTRAKDQRFVLMDTVLR